MKPAYTRYGPPDVVEVNDLDKPVPRDNKVLIRIRVASVVPLDWKTMTGGPFIVRLLLGLRKPRIKPLGVDVAGTVEAVGKNVPKFKPGDGVFSAPDGGLCRVCLYFRGAINFEVSVDRETGQYHFRASGLCTDCGAHRIARASRQRKNSAGAKSADQRPLGGCRHFRCADRQVVRRGCNRSVRHQKCRYGPDPSVRTG